MEYMKWSDLEPGDIIKIKNVVAKKFANYTDWVNRFCYKDFKVSSISCFHNMIHIRVYGLESPFNIYDNGLAWGVDEEVFELVKLRDE